MTANDNNGVTLSCTSLSVLLRENTQRFQSRPALRMGEREYSYGELWALALPMAHAITASKSPFLGILGQKSPAMYAGIYAAICAGCPYLPLNVDDPIERLHYMIDETACTLLLADEGDYECLHKLLNAIKHPLTVLLSGVQQKP